MPSPLWFRDDRIRQAPDSVNFSDNFITWLQVTDAFRRPCQDQITRTQSHEIRQILNQRGDPKDHIAGIAVLFSLAVDKGPQSKRHRIGNIHCIHHPRTEWCAKIPVFYPQIGPVVVFQVFPQRVIISNRVSSHIVVSLFLADAATLTPDYHGELAFEVHLPNIRRAWAVSVVPYKRVWPLEEYERSFRSLEAELGCM